MNCTLRVNNLGFGNGQVNIYQSGHRIILSIADAVELRDQLTRQLPPPPVSSVLTLLQAIESERKALADAHEAQSTYDQRHAYSVLAGARARTDAIRDELRAMTQRVAA